jgi:hypothetical protein
MPNAVVFYILSCTHVMPGTPGNLKLYCMKCDKDRNVSDIHYHEWAVVCCGCSYVRYAGLNKAIAGQLANRHARSKRHTRVGIEYRAHPKWFEERERLEKSGLLSPYDVDPGL